MGSLKRVYVIHGWTYSIDKWAELTDLLKKAGSVAVMLMVPGLTADSNEVWDLEKYIEWLHQAISAEKEPVTLVGHSNGGRLALAFAGRYPERVKQLILIDSAGVYHNEPTIRLKRTIFGAAARAGKRLTGSPVLRKALYKLARAQDYQQANPNMRQTMTNLLEADKSLDLSLVTMPVTLIWGDQDKTTPLRDGRLMASELAQSDLRIVHGARHSPFYTHAPEVAHIIVEALK